ncbi:MAG: hypothetical protein HY277_09185 [Ignavibacteriales bacterium]|nr:hypothetical protein [Ignavibacteriales bacterium]
MRADAPAARTIAATIDELLYCIGNLYEYWKFEEGKQTKNKIALTEVGFAILGKALT